jgi:hypothetical protein
VQKTGAPLTHGFSLSKGNGVLDLARRKIEKAEDNWRFYMEKFGADVPWLLEEPLDELAVEELPAMVGPLNMSLIRVFALPHKSRFAADSGLSFLGRKARRVLSSRLVPRRPSSADRREREGISRIHRREALYQDY